MKKLICLCLIVSVLFSAIGIYADESFAYTIDGYTVSPAADKADVLQKLGLFHGTEKGFELERAVTRAEAITMVIRMIGEENEAFSFTSTNNFDDVSPEHWAQATISYAAQKGYIHGTSETTFEPERTVTGQEFAKMLLTAFGYPEISLDSAYEAGIKFSLLTNEHAKMSVATEGYPLLRNDVVNLCYCALLARMPDGSSFLKDVLIEKGIFDEETLNSLLIAEKADSAEGFAWQLNALMPKDENYMFSPLSIKIALAMAANGADGNTRDEILKALQINDLDEFNRFSKELIYEYASNEKVNLSIANSLWLNTDTLPGTDFSSEFKEAAGEYYDAEIGTVNNENAVDKINNWVKEKTNEKITSLISEPDFLAYLVNAIYFKGEWAKQFNEGATEKSEFTDRNGNKSETDFMNQTGYFDYYGDDTLQMVKLPYSDGKTSMYIALTTEQSGLDKYTENMTSKRVALSIPKFKTEFKTELIDHLKNLGITTAFDKDHADLKKMFTEISENAFISDVVHKTFINVDENGTEAAAVTGVGVGLTSIPTDEPIEFIANRPFTYFIRDDINGEILFMGEYAFNK